MNRNEMSDESLMHRYADENDLEAFEVLVDRHEQGVYNFILRAVGQEALAEEILQETFIAVIDGADDWEEEAKFSTWLYSIARYRCIDALRKKRASVSLDESPDDQDGRPRIRDVADEGSDEFEGRPDQRRAARELMDAVEDLPAEQRETFLLREVSELSFPEIAEATGAAVGTSKSRLRLAMEKLRRKLSSRPEIRELMELE